MYASRSELDCLIIQVAHSRASTVSDGVFYLSDAAKYLCFRA